MILARNRNGQVGRQVPGVGLQAVVDISPEAARRRNVFVSTRSIEEDQIAAQQETNEILARRQQERIRNIAERAAETAKMERQRANTIQFQKLAMLDPMNERLKDYFSMKAGMGESQTVQAGLLRNPADFSSQGGNPQIVASQSGKRPIAWSADFRQHLIVGNPLTRDGAYGPAVTDYDRFVNGTDVNQEDVVEIAGGTMLGRYEGRVMPAGLASSKRMRLPRGMGFDFSWSGLVDTATNVINQTADQVVSKLPEQLAKELQNAINQGGTVQSTAGGTVVVQRPVVGTTTTQTQMVGGVPNWVLYAGGGLLAVGFLLILVKAVK